MSTTANLDRVADVLIRVALRLAEHDKEIEEEVSSADSGVLPGLD